MKMLCPACKRLVTVKPGGALVKHRVNGRRSNTCKESAKDTLFLFGRGLREREMTMLDARR